MKILLALSLIFSVFTNTALSNAKNEVYLETKELDKDQFVVTSTSPNGEYLVLSKYQILKGLKNQVNAVPDFQQYQKPTTLIIDLLSGKTRRVVKGFVFKSHTSDPNTIIGLKAGGYCLYDINKNTTTLISNIPKDAMDISVNKDNLVFALVNGFKVKWHLGKINNNSFSLTKELDGGGGSSIVFKPDGNMLLAQISPRKSKMYEYDVSNGNLLKSYKSKEKGIFVPRYSKDGKYFIHTAGSDIYIKDAKSLQTQVVINNKVKGIIKTSHFSFNKDLSRVVTVSPLDGGIRIWNGKTGSMIKEFYETKKAKLKNPALSLARLTNDKFLITYKNGVSAILSLKEENVIANLYFDYEDWAVIAKDGRIEGTENAINEIFWHDYDSKEKVSLAATYQTYYTPRLLPKLITNSSDVQTNADLSKIVTGVPEIEIVQPENTFTSPDKEVNVLVKAVDKGSGIDEVRLYLNGKLLETSQRGFKSIQQQDLENRTYTITLVNGENNIKAIALNKHGIESKPDFVTVNYEGTQKSSDLYVLVLGINSYKNPKYNLNYALSDATSFKNEIEKGGKTIFNNVEVSFLQDQNVNKQAIEEAFESLKSKAMPEDVFIFYYAGHGVMSEETNPQFYIIPSDVTQLYGNNEMLKSKAVSAAELQQFSADLKAQKQMFVFDACQSGGMADHLALRGAAEEKAIAQLARSTGTFWLTASGSEQFATEFEQLGHGVFTYAILSGLKGEADGGKRDKKITVKELSAYLNDRVPELSAKHKGEAQFPTSYGYGQDFPIIITK